MDIRYGMRVPSATPLCHPSSLSQVATKTEIARTIERRGMFGKLNRAMVMANIVKVLPKVITDLMSHITSALMY